MLHSLKGENSEILAKSFELMLNDNNIQKKEEKQNKRKTVKIAKNHILVDYNEKSKINGEVIFPTKIPKKNILLDKYINSTKNKNSVNVNFNLRNINNNPSNKTGKKYLDIKTENNISDYKTKNTKSNSIINNFITFSNVSKNQISNYSNIYNNNTNISNSNISRRSVPVSVSKNNKELKIKSARRQISPFKLFANYLTIDKHKSPLNKTEFKTINKINKTSRKTDATLKKWLQKKQNKENQ